MLFALFPTNLILGKKIVPEIKSQNAKMPKEPKCFWPIRL